jgi:hypothetical protein
VVSLEFFDRRTRAEQIPVAVNTVDARDGGPKFVFARPRSGKSCLFARVGTVPFVRGDLPRGVRRVFEQVVLSILFSVSDGFHLCVNGNHRVAKTVELVFWFTLGRLDHHRTGDGPGNRWRVKPIIHQPFCYVFDLDACAFPLAKIDDALMRNESAFAFEKYRKIGIESLRDVIRIQDCDLACVF